MLALETFRMKICLMNQLEIASIDNLISIETFHSWRIKRLKTGFLEGKVWDEIVTQPISFSLTTKSSFASGLDYPEPRELPLCT